MPGEPLGGACMRFLGALGDASVVVGSRAPCAAMERGSEMDGKTKFARIASVIAIAVGALMVIGGAATWFQVSSTLAAERITVSEDATCAAGAAVDGPIAAYCEADIINTHALEATGGKTYAELDREDPLRPVAMNGSFLRASLFTSVVSFGVALLAIGTGATLILLGAGLNGLVSRQQASAGKVSVPA